MRILIDIGNTEVTLGVADDDQLTGHARLTTTPNHTADEWAMAIEAVLTRRGHDKVHFRSACLASVAPAVTPHLVAALQSGICSTVTLLDPDAEIPLTLDVDEPQAVGADRIANALGVLERFPGESIVVDFGTATTFDCVTADRRFVGGSIMPGLRSSADQLVARAAQLTATTLEAPLRAIGRTTREHLQAGILFGAADAIDGMVGRIRAEWPGESEPKVVATGGLAGTIAPLATTIDAVDPDLTLHGLRIAADALGLPR